MRCYQQIENSSPTSQQSVSRKNGVHKELDKTEDKASSSENCLACFRFVDDLSVQARNTFYAEGEKLNKILEKDSKNLEAVSKFVQSHKDISVTWKNREYSLQLCDLSGTDYMGQEYMQEAWEELYPPNITRMQVFGTLKYTRPTLTSVPVVILVGEDGYIYAYENEELQLIAKSLQEFVKIGKNKVHESYNYPECSDEDDECVQKDEEIQKIRERGKDFVNKSAKKFDDFLSYFSSLS